MTHEWSSPRLWTRWHIVRDIYRRPYIVRDIAVGRHIPFVTQLVVDIYHPWCSWHMFDSYIVRDTVGGGHTSFVTFVTYISFATQSVEDKYREVHDIYIVRDIYTGMYRSWHIYTYSMAWHITLGGWHVLFVTHTNRWLMNDLVS